MSKKKYKKLQDEISSDLPLRERILKIFSEYPGDLFKTNEISKMIGIKSDSSEYQTLRDELRKMEGEHLITHGTRRRYGIVPMRPSQITGSLKMQPTGNAIVKPEKDSGLN